jgi:hypothetical protein
MERVLKVSFVTDQGKNTTISIPKVRSDLTNTEVKNFMNALIASGIVETSGGLVTEKMKGTLYATTVAPYELPAEDGEGA